jgi:biotin-(acetyl-CoA carboxylase) ligase
MRGRRVAIRELDGNEQEGWVEGIDEDGALRLALAGGASARFLAGDVTIAKEGA